MNDLDLVSAAEDAVDNVSGLTHATLAVLYKTGPQYNRGVRSLKIIKSIVARHTAVTLGLMTYPLTYYEGMPEAELRAWAAGVVGALRAG